MNELFDIPEQLSPRLAWIQKHGVQTHHAKHFDHFPWCAWFPANNTPCGKAPDNPDDCGFGQNQDDALAALARRHDIRLWNEE